ncbi:MAG: type II secretion system F family protein [Candidatus Thorarchaeota archaeon]
MCRLGRRIPLLSRTDAGRVDRDLARAVRFLRPSMSLDVNGVVGAARLLAIVAWSLSLLSLIALTGSVIVSIPLSLMVGLLAYYAAISYPINLMNAYRIALSEESDLIFEQFVLVFQSGGTIFDAIELVARSSHPVLSRAFQEMLSRINDGVPPETCLLEFARDQPSDDLRRYIMGVISSLERKTEMLDLLSGQSFEAEMTLRSKNLELESRLLVVAALATYVPVLVTLAVSLTGSASSPVVLAAAPFLMYLNMFLRVRFSRSFSVDFDRPRSPGPLAPNQRDIMTEYEEFLNFLILLSERLRAGDTLEHSLPEIRGQVSTEIQTLIDPVIHAIIEEHADIREAMRRAAERSKGLRVSRMFLMIPEMCEISCVNAGDRLGKIAGKLVSRSHIAKERDSIVQAQRFKVYLLTLTSAVVLGMLTSLSPFLFIGGLLNQTTGGSTGLVAGNPFYLFVTMLSVVAFSGHQNSVMVGGRRPRLTASVCALLYWTSFSLSSLLLGSGLA